MENNNVLNEVHGFKVFSYDWICSPYGITKRYTCPGEFEEDVTPEVCGCGMHFCKKAADCFNYYRFDPENKVAEVIAYGTVAEKGDKCCTNKLKIVREISWDEVLRIVNTGENCTGLHNTGDYNIGNYNSGTHNAGDHNSGNCNTGDCNTGSHNTGDYNSGNHNAGNYNTRNCNTGNCNSGNCNTGNCNTGDCNTGSHNTGNRNTGDWNKSSFNTGCFMTVEQNISMFNKPSNWTLDDWCCSAAKILLDQMPFGDKAPWVKSSNMTNEEKMTYPTHETTGGYLKSPNTIERRQAWWDHLTDKQKDIIRKLPNFDPEIFEQCTGIKVERS